MSARKKWVTAPGDVIDAHLHLFTVGIFEEYLAAHPEAAERYKKGSPCSATWTPGTRPLLSSLSARSLRG